MTCPTIFSLKKKQLHQHIRMIFNNWISAICFIVIIQLNLGLCKRIRVSQLIPWKSNAMLVCDNWIETHARNTWICCGKSWQLQKRCDFLKRDWNRSLWQKSSENDIVSIEFVRRKLTVWFILEKNITTFRQLGETKMDSKSICVFSET